MARSKTLRTWKMLDKQPTEQRKCRRIVNRAIKTIQRLNKKYGKTTPSVEVMRRMNSRIANRPAKAMARFERTRDSQTA